MTNLTLDSLRLTGLRFLAGVIGALAAIAVVGAVAVGGEKLWAAPLALLLAAYPVMTTLSGRNDPASRMAVGLTVPTMPALLLFIFEGFAWQTDLHMIFFAVLAMTVMLCDWRVILGATVVVAVHHLGLGLLFPDWVFLNGGSLGRILLHAVILLAETAILVWTAQRFVQLLDGIAAENARRTEIEETARRQREQEAATQAAVLGSLDRSLAALSRGDLAAEIDEDFPSAYAQLRGDFNDALAGLRSLIAAVAKSATHLRAGSSEIAQASEDLARRTEDAAASLEKTSTAIARMDERLKATAVAASSTVTRADQAIATVNGGRGLADDAVGAMGRVSDSAKGIDSVIEGVDKIAFQTRVLAMNAAVEAGRAGDAGRGFAVVADLVSALAMRAEEEAKRARDQLTVTQSEIIIAVEAVEKVDGALVDISTEVGGVHELLNAMAADNQAQAAAVGEISAAIATMDQATQQNAAMVEETSAAARNLTGEAMHLAEQAGRFNVDLDDDRPRAAKRRESSIDEQMFEAPARPLPSAAVSALTRPD